MAFVPTPNTIQVHIRGTLDEQRVENTLYFQFASEAFTDTAAQSVATYVDTWYKAEMIPLLSEEYQLREIYAVDISQADGPTYTVPSLPPANGGVASAPPSNQDTLCVSFRTAKRGRSFRGRNYVSGLPANFIFMNNWQDTTVNAVVAAYDQILLDLELPQYTFQWVIVSRFADNAPRTTGVATPVTNALAVDTVVDSQRRRLPGRGR